MSRDEPLCPGCGRPVSECQAEDVDESPAATAEPRERPEIRNVEDFWCWLNTWGDERKRSLGSITGEGYRLCIGDAMKALEAAGVTFDTVPNETWERWTGWK